MQSGWLPAAVLTALGLLVSRPALAFDCAQARAPIERAICADPAAKASDVGMESAFETVRGDLAGPQRQAALDDQRAWLKERNTACTADETPAACVLKRNGKRTAFLTARPASGPGPAQALVPVFVRQAGSKTRIEVGLQLYRFAQDALPGERTLNAETDRVIAKTPRAKDEPDDTPWGREETWRVSYASPAFLSIVRDTYEYSGGAHGSSGTAGLNIDMATGRVLGFADLFDKAGAAELSKLCLARIRAEKKSRGADGEDIVDVPKAVGEVVRDLANWSFTDREASVYFDQYAVGAYAEGAYECILSIDTVNRLSRRTMPLR